MSRVNIRMTVLCGLFICFAAALSAFETWLPPICPIPGVRVGLGNIVTLFVLYLGGRWGAGQALCISVLRCFLAALITGSLMHAAYGIAGGVLALAAMLVVRWLMPKDNRERYLPITGAFGAIFHITGQLMVAVLFYGTFSVLAYFPILLASAVIGGAFTGACTMLLLKKMDKRILDGVRKI